MEYRTVAQLDDAVVSWLGDLPRGIDIVAGIPRSGLLVANLLALHLNIPMTDVAGLLEGRVIQAGARFKGSDPRKFLSTPRHVLVVDDSVCSGTAMQKVRAQLAAAALPHRISFAAVYMAPEARLDGHVDLYREIVSMPRVFEWNLMHGTVLSNSCMDIDGVLCLDPTDEENDDANEYLRFLRDTPALLLPSAPVGWLVTSRLEKYRPQTVEWLARHKVQFGELRMMQYPDMAARRAAKAYAQFKADIYLETGAWLFIESDAAVAVQIAQLCGKSVFCTETREMLGPGDSPSPARRAAPPQEPALSAALRHRARHAAAIARSLPQKLSYRASMTCPPPPAVRAGGGSPQGGNTAMPRKYEVVYIFDAALEDAAINDTLTRVHALLGTNDVAVEHWGKRQLAYPIGRRETGHYTIAHFEAEATTLPEYERALKLDEGVVRYLITLHEHEVGAPPMTEEEIAAGRGRASDDDDDED